MAARTPPSPPLRPPVVTTPANHHQALSRLPVTAACRYRYRPQTAMKHLSLHQLPLHTLRPHRDFAGEDSTAARIWRLSAKIFCLREYANFPLLSPKGPTGDLTKPHRENIVRMVIQKPANRCRLHIGNPHALLPDMVRFAKPIRLAEAGEASWLNSIVLLVSVTVLSASLIRGPAAARRLKRLS